jgi:hypothetical protein
MSGKWNLLAECNDILRQLGATTLIYLSEGHLEAPASRPAPGDAVNPGRSQQVDERQ